MHGNRKHLKEAYDGVAQPAIEPLNRSDQYGADGRQILQRHRICMHSQTMSKWSPALLRRLEPPSRL